MKFLKALFQSQFLFFTTIFSLIWDLCTILIIYNSLFYKPHPGNNSIKVITFFLISSFILSLVVIKTIKKKM